MQFELHVFTSNTGVDVRIFVPKNYRLETLHSRYLRLTKNGAEPSTNQQGNLLFKVQTAASDAAGSCGCYPRIG